MVGIAWNIKIINNNFSHNFDAGQGDGKMYYKITKK